MRGNERVVALGIAALIAGAQGCTQESETTDVDRAEGLHLTLTGTEVAGSFVAAEHTIDFAIDEIEPNLIGLELRIDSETIGLTVDLALGEASYDIPSMVFDDSVIVALEGLAYALIDALEGPDKTPTEDQLLRATAFLARAPSGVKLSSFDFVAEKGWTHISCSCSYKYIGSGYYRTAGKGSWCTGGSGNGCKGRCGVGCGSGGRGAYTRDCAKHDYGLTSWWRASDDFTFAGWNC
jgi:hypothetical protein